ncbi:MAG: type VI secretion system protein TssA [Burkholderiales bacterium]|nr:type VI secretion system protein TssA [Burkholderiales bacterium]
MMDSEYFSPDLEPLLAPIPGDSPCGPSVRYDPAFLALRQARSEDDASLPMREWERPLKKADWRAVAHECTTLIAGRSKDIQLAAWLCDAWTRQHHAAGFAAGAKLLLALVERYWDTVHPVIEDGDNEARVAPFVWMNEALPLTLKLQVPLMFLPDHKPATLCLADWEQIIAAGSARDRGEQAPSLNREQLIALAEGRSLYRLLDLQEQLQQAQSAWDSLSRLLDEKLALDAPSLGKVAETLRKMERACISLLNGRDPRAPVTPAAEPQGQHDEEVFEPEEGSPMSTGNAPSAPETAVAMPSGPISSRQEAYRMLEAAAAYLQRTEPHSPTPYLVKRAVTWGQMSLADLMQEILREEGDLTRYFSLLGLNPPRD